MKQRRIGAAVGAATVGLIAFGFAPAYAADPVDPAATTADAGLLSVVDGVLEIAALDLPPIDLPPLPPIDLPPIGQPPGQEEPPPGQEEPPPGHEEPPPGEEEEPPPGQEEEPPPVIDVPQPEGEVVVAPQPVSEYSCTDPALCGKVVQTSTTVRKPTRRAASLPQVGMPEHLQWTAFAGLALVAGGVVLVTRKAAPAGRHRLG